VLYIIITGSFIQKGTTICSSPTKLPQTMHHRLDQYLCIVLFLSVFSHGQQVNSATDHKPPKQAPAAQTAAI
jgi:hypothetical protein